MIIGRSRATLPTSYVDVVFNLLLGITFLFFLAFLLIKPVTENKKIDTPAEFMAILEWDDHHNSDIDLWTMAPNGNTVGFSSKEKGVASLERDDLGALSDTHYDNETGLTTYVKTNREVITIRGIVPGEWIVNVHYYASRPLPPNHYSGKKTIEVADLKRIPAEVTVRVVKLNPTYKIITEKTIILTFEGEERTMSRFEIDKSGKVIGSSEDPMPFVLDNR